MSSRYIPSRFLNVLKRSYFSILTLLLVTVLGTLIYSHICCDSPRKFELLTYYYSNAQEELGVVNLVSSIYLGYRAYDTLGETLALVLAVVSGTFLARGTKSERL